MRGKPPRCTPPCGSAHDTRGAATPASDTEAEQKSARVGCGPTRAAQLIPAGQVNHVVGEVELHFVKREVREGDLLRVDRVPIAVIAEHDRATVGVNLQVPDLEVFAGNASIMLLSDCDDVEQPVNSALVGKELCAVGIQDCAIGGNRGT